MYNQCDLCFLLLSPSPFLLFCSWWRFLFFFPPCLCLVTAVTAVNSLLWGLSVADPPLSVVMVLLFLTNGHMPFCPALCIFLRVPPSLPRFFPSFLPSILSFLHPPTLLHSSSNYLVEQYAKLGTRPPLLCWGQFWHLSAPRKNIWKYLKTF